MLFTEQNEQVAYSEIMKCMTSKIITPFVLICLLSCLLFLLLVLPLYDDPGFSTFFLLVAWIH